MNKDKGVNELIDNIIEGVNSKEEVDYFAKIFGEMLNCTSFDASTISNDFFYRVRPATDRLFESIAELKYPPSRNCKQGRLNYDGEAIMYMSVGEIAPLLEMGISYYDLFCQIKIKAIDKSTFFHYVGIFNKESNALDKRINELMRSLLNSQGDEYYNATNALGNIFLKKEIRDVNGKNFSSGMAYTSVHQEKTNKPIRNIAMLPSVFDEKYKVVEAIYYVMTLNAEGKFIGLEPVNHSVITNNGDVLWNLSFDEMKNLIEEKYSSHKYIVDNRIYHYHHGSGKIMSIVDGLIYANFKGKIVKLKSDEINII